MPNRAIPVRLNIYLPDQDIRRRIRLMAAERNLTLSQFCIEALEAQLSQTTSGKQSNPLSQAVDGARKFQQRTFGKRVFKVNSTELIRQSRR